MFQLYVDASFQKLSGKGNRFLNYTHKSKCYVLMASKRKKLTVWSTDLKTSLGGSGMLDLTQPATSDHYAYIGLNSSIVDNPLIS